MNVDNAPMLAAHVAGFLPKDQLQKLIASIATAGYQSDDRTQTDACIQLLRDGYFSWTGEVLS